VHCVDCVREASRTVKPTRTVLGAPVRGATPIVSFVLIGMNVVSFLLQSALGSRNNPWTQALVFAPGIGDEEPWRFLTTAFLHSTGSIMHIVFNMYALWIVGQALEPALGRARYLALYLVSAVGGSVMVLLLASPTGDEWYRGVVGASGAVFGMFGAVLVIQHRLHRDVRGIVGLLVINAVIGFVFPNISWQAHLGGFLVGATLGAAYAYAPKTWRPAVAFAAPAAMMVVLVALATLKYAFA
jgi:membrane associated rhomboid family serine protease